MRSPQAPQDELDSLVPVAMATISAILTDTPDGSDLDADADEDGPSAKVLDQKHNTRKLRLAAAQDVLDRTGFVKKQIIETQTVALPPATLEAAIRGLGALFQLEIDAVLQPIPASQPQRDVTPTRLSPPKAEQQLSALREEAQEAEIAAKKKQASLANRPLPSNLLARIQGATRDH